MRTDGKHKQYSRRRVNSCPAQVAEPRADTSTSVVALADGAMWPREAPFMGRPGFEAGFPRQSLENCDGFSIIQPYPLNNPVTYF